MASSVLLDRSSAPLSIPYRTSEERVQAIVALRRLRFTAPEIAETLGMALSTVSGILTRIGMGRLGRLGLEPAVRYERERPGELIHIDVKELGRIQGGAGKRVTGKPRHDWERSDRSGTRRKVVGWEYVHIAIDDCTRLAYAEVLPDEKASSAVAFLRRARAFYRRHGIRDRAAHHRQWRRLPLDRSRRGLPLTRYPPPPHPPLPPSNKR
jgi:Integrase core domain